MMKYTKKLEDSIYNLIKKENPTFEHLSRTLNINYNDLKEYINKSNRKYKKSLAKKIRKAKDEYFKDAKIKIENALIKKALGYYTKDTIKEIKTDKDGKESFTKRTVYKYNPPSERAIIVFLELIKTRNTKRLEKRKLKEEENKINIRVGFDN
ncbi:hypothetical protein [uncultured Brachyspira sp.]|uniref:hypothetical protein n=1 Tax=uncultured Brachyspira sp. TaxID=221953 RepID=UPI00345BF4E2